MGECEEWRPVLGYEGLYEVSSQGRVRSVDRTVSLRDHRGRIYQTRRYTGQILRPCPHIESYPQVKLSKCGRVVNRFVHVLVCEAFHGPRPHGRQAAHNDGNRLNGKANNLRWATRSENESDKVRHGTHLRGSRTHNCKLTADQVRAIRAAASEGATQKSLGERYGVAENTISNITRRRNWRWVD